MLFCRRRDELKPDYKQHWQVDYIGPRPLIRGKKTTLCKNFELFEPYHSVAIQCSFAVSANSHCFRSKLILALMWSCVRTFFPNLIYCRHFLFATASARPTSQPDQPSNHSTIQMTIQRWRWRWRWPTNYHGRAEQSRAEPSFFHILALGDKKFEWPDHWRYGGKSGILTHFPSQIAHF